MKLSQSQADILGSILGIGVVIAICIWSCGCSTPRRAAPDDVRYVVPCAIQSKDNTKLSGIDPPLTTLERDDAYLSLPPYSIDTVPVDLLLICKHHAYTTTLLGCPDSQCNTCTCMNCGKQWKC